MQTPSEDHTQFDAICAHVGDFEPLPTLASSPSDVDEDNASDDALTAPLDGLILAGLVSP